MKKAEKMKDRVGGGGFENYIFFLQIIYKDLNPEYRKNL